MHCGTINFPVLVVVCSLLPVTLWSAGDARAMGLGRMNVLSNLGSPFEAEVQLLDASDNKQPGAECFRLGQSGEADLPTLKRGRLTVVARDGGFRLRIVSEQAIDEPLLQVNLRVGCGSEVARNYVLLIDPPTHRASPKAVELPVARREEFQESLSRPLPRPERRIAAEQRATPGERFLAPLAPPLEVARTSRAPGTGTTDRKVATGKAGDRLLISGDNDKPQRSGELPLRLSTRLSTELIGKTSEHQRAMLRIEYQLLGTLHTQAAQQLAVAEQVRRLEAMLREVQQKSEAQGVPTRQASPAVATTTTTRPAPAQAIDHPVKPPVTATASASPNLEASDWWLELGLLAALIAGLSWFLRRRSGEAHNRPAMISPAEEPADSGQFSRWELHTGTRDTDSRLASAESELKTDNLLAHDGVSSDADVFAGRPADDEATAVLELAEIMLSFGRSKGAQQALEEFITQQPTAAVTPWLKLLEVYRQSDQRAAFEALGLKLTGHFNVAPPDWQTTEETAPPAFQSADQTTLPVEQLVARLPSVGRMAHIRNELVRTWDSPDCLTYLNTLLRDNRNGERKGFPLAAVRELLLLIDIQEGRQTPRT